MTILTLSHKLRYSIPVLGLLLAVPGAAASTPASGSTLERISVREDGNQLTQPSGFSSIAAGGSAIAFLSDASTLVPGDTNSAGDVFVYDRDTKKVERVSVSSGGDQLLGPYGEDTHTDISANGRWVVFSTSSPGLVEGDSNGTGDVFVHDRAAHTTTLVSAAPDGTPGNGASFEGVISDSGRYVGFQSVATNLSDVRLPDTPAPVVRSYVRDLTTGKIRLVGVSSEGVPANNHTTGISLSADGRYAAFDSPATNLVPGDSNNRSDVFVRDLFLERTRRISLSSKEAQAKGGSSESSISGDGRYVAFMSDAPNLVAGDTNRKLDVFVRDLLKGTTRRVSVSSSGSQANGMSFFPHLAAARPVVVFVSRASNLVKPASSLDHIYRHNWETGRTIRVDGTPSGVPGNDISYRPDVSSSGRLITFSSRASNLVPRDTNDVSDVFLWRM